VCFTGVVGGYCSALLCYVVCNLNITSCCIASFAVYFSYFCLFFYNDDLTFSFVDLGVKQSSVLVTHIHFVCFGSALKEKRKTNLEVREPLGL